MLQDLWYAIRALRRNSTFALVVGATFALGIGMNTAVFSVANAVLFQPVPYPHASRLVWIANSSRRLNRDLFTAYPEYLFWKAQARSFERMAAYGDDDFALVAGGQATQERIACVTGDFWSMTDGRPAAGRLFGEHEANALMLSWRLYGRRFGGDPQVIGTTVTLGGHPFRVVGALTQDFRFALPQQYIPGDQVRGIDGYIAVPDGILSLPTPLPASVWEDAQQRLGPSVPNVYAIGRLKAGVTYDDAASEMRAIYPRFTSSEPFRPDNALDIAPVAEKEARAERRPLFVLLAGAGFVLLIACANIANLLIARTASRRREAAIRAAIGAGRLQLIRQPVLECLLLALAGGAAGLLGARFCLQYLTGIVLSGGRQLGPVALDDRVLWFTAAITVITGLVAGLGPGLPLWRLRLSDALNAGSPSGGTHRLRGRGVLVAAELGFAVVLLAGAGLMVRSFWQMNRRPEGFVPENILSMQIMLSGPRYDSWLSKLEYTEQLLSRVHRVPGVVAAGVQAGTLNAAVHVGTGDPIAAAIRAVSPGYLPALGVPLVEGRWPQPDELFGVVVNQAFARKAPGELVGRTIGGSILNDPIIGIVADFKAQQLDADPLPEVYMPYQRLGRSRSMRVLVRAGADARTIAAPIREVLTQVDRTQPAYEFERLDQALADSIAPRRFQLALLAVFAASALLLALIGIHGVMVWSVTQRSREIGVRLALGAGRREIILLVVQQGMRVALIGMGAGLLAAAGLTRVMASLLYGVKPDDLRTFVAVTSAMTVSALAACWRPALRAARVDPAVALRGD